MIKIFYEYSAKGQKIYAKENLGKLDQSGEDDIFVTNGLGKNYPLNLAWLDEDEVVNDKLVKSKSAKKSKKKVEVRLPRPVTRSQKRESTEEDLKCNPAPSPGRVTRTKFHKKRSK